MRSKQDVAAAGCIMVVTQFIGFVISFILAAFMMNYSLGTLIGHGIPFIFAAILGLLVAPLNFVVFVVCLVLHLAGVHVPVFHA